MKSNNLTITLLLLIPGTLWGVSFLLNEIVLQTIPPFTLTTGRALISAVPLTLMLYARGGRFPSTWQGWKPYIILGILNNSVPFVLISWGQLHIESGLTTILTSLMPLFTVLLAHFFSQDERLNSSKAIGITLGLLGVLVLVGPTALSGLSVNFWAQMAVVGGALCYAIAGIYARHHLQNKNKSTSPFDSILMLTSSQYVTSTISILPLALLIDRPWTLQPSTASLLGLFTLAWGITIGAVLVYYYIIDVAGASVAATTIYLIPINGVFWGALILNEEVTWGAIVALVLILSGIALVNEIRLISQLRARLFRHTT